MKSKKFLYISIACFLLSLALPVQFDLSEFLESSNSYLLGLLYLLSGYITIFDAKVDFICWLGNITILLSWIFLWKNKVSKFLSLLAFVQMSLFGFDYIFELKIIDVIDYESLPVGYLFWLASSIFMIIYHFYPIQNNIKNI